MSDKSQKPLACAYVRSSTNDISINTQRERLLSLAEREGYDIIAEYVDDDCFGDDPNRPGWRRLLADAPTAEWTVVLCLHRTRFSRLNGIENGMAVQKLKEAGKRLHTAIEGPMDWDATACEIINQMIDAEEGVTPPIVVEAGEPQPDSERPVDSAAPEEQIIVPGDPKEAEVVQRIFDAYTATDATLDDIASQLNAKGVSRPADPEKNSN